MFTYFLLQMNSLFLLPLIVLNLWAFVVLQSLITLIANFLSIKILLTCFFGSFTSSCLCFLLFELYFVVMSRKFLWSNPSSICFSFNHNIPSLSIIVSIPFLSYFFLLISSNFISCIPQKCQDFLFRFSSHYIFTIFLAVIKKSLISVIIQLSQILWWFKQISHWKNERQNWRSYD